MDWHIFISAFALGLLSSFHCVGMCGAIAFSLPTQHLNPAKKIAGIISYNVGRILTYTLLGVLFGVVGRSLYLGGFQQWFSIVAGILILLVVIQTAIGKPLLHIPRFTRVNLFVQKLITRSLQKATIGRMLLLGIGNGLLPCGLIYLAITGALAAGSITGAAGFMFAFGLGTFPAMFLLSYFSFIIRISTRKFITKAVPYVVALMGVLLIIRGLGLDIPYVSPGLTNHAEQVIICH